MTDTNKLAVTSVLSGLIAIICVLIFGATTFVGLHIIGAPLVILSICLFILAFISGVVALWVITLGHRSLRNYMIACTGILISAVPMYFIVGVLQGSRARAELGKAHVGIYNLRLLGTELKKYAKANNGYLPLATEWCDSLLKRNLKLSESNFRHPQSMRLNLKGNCHFAFNKNLSGKRLADIPPDVVLVFEANGDWNLAGGAELLQTRRGEHGYITMFFVDGSERNYWFDENAIRKFDKNGTSMYYEQPRWQP